MHSSFARKLPAHTRLMRGTSRSERGVTLLEVLVAIVVLALGLLGIMGVQMRTLADTQSAVRRAQAIRAVEDLSERIRVNPDALSATVMPNYVADWGPVPAPPACAMGCTPENLALYQIRTWKQRLVQHLPTADATTFFVADEAAATARRQLGVLISWRGNERTLADDYVGVFTTSSSSAAVACPAKRTCHLQFIALGARCVPDPLSGPGLPVGCANSLARLP